MRHIEPFAILALIILLIGSFALCSCSGTLREDVRDPITGVIVDEQGQAKADQQTVNTVFDKARRLIYGEDAKDVILTPSK